MKKRKLKWTITLLLTSTILLGTVTMIVSDKYFNENNPYSVMKGIIQIQLSEHSVVKINQQKHRYITPNKTFEGDPYGIVKQFMQREGWTFQSQQKGVLTFIKGDETTVVKTKPFTSDYYIFDITDQSETIS
ncbi:hypothetical protein [Pontibacillus sp. HMF3514]|uniref:hypothetical protein n=1 Tax=Pontibacillus sp. HMF3514 TaxID=2692425 RepID=UPI0013204B49|nr:hypothetical protein [Pontibacillus sp. HMF3514]QHE52083.1 hypothetical protein GS400_08610 [Pontibacillus sp. HMF3514]